MSKLLFVLPLMLFFAARGLAQGKWELKKNQNGIAVYTRTAVKGNLKELRVVCELDASEKQLIATLQDIGNYTKWVYGNKRSYILKTPNPETIIYYTEAHLIWPVKDRDLIVQLNIDQSDPKELKIVVKSLPQYLPVNKDFIRVPYSLALWNVTPVTENKLKVDYSFSIDPGGAIPAWLVNATMAIGPYNSFVKLKEVLKNVGHSVH
jgi:hypothetical protein